MMETEELQRGKLTEENDGGRREIGKEEEEVVNVREWRGGRQDCTDKRRTRDNFKFCMQ
jgi:hypothetical protein